jgi:hypothetical protein
MPRKQRFKPSRKPKPTPPSEDAGMGRPITSTPADIAHTPGQEKLQDRDAPSLSGVVPQAG